MKHKRIVTLFIIGTVIATLASVYQLIDMTDTATGFFKIQFQKAGWLVSAFIGIVVACIGLISCQSRRLPKAPNTSSPVFAAISVAYAVGSIYEVFANGFVLSLSSPLQLIVKVFCFLAAGAVVVLGLRGIIKCTSFGLLALLPLCYSLLRLILPFARYSHLPAIAQNVYELAFLCLQLVFWLYAAMLLNNINIHKAIAFLLPVSLMTACVCSVIAVPHLVAYFVKPEVIHEGAVHPVFLPFFALYSVFYVLDIFSLKRMYKRVAHSQKAAGISNAEFYTGDKK